MRSAAPTPTHRQPLRRTSGVLFAGALALTLTATPALSVVADAAPDAPTNATTDPAAGVDRVTGPLPVTAGSYPFGAADHQMLPQDLAAIGYVEEEYLVSGLSNVYTWPETGPAEVITPDAPYTTRILVRRPADPDYRHLGGGRKPARRAVAAVRAQPDLDAGGRRRWPLQRRGVAGLYCQLSDLGPGCRTRVGAHGALMRH